MDKVPVGYCFIIVSKQRHTKLRTKSDSNIFKMINSSRKFS